MKDNILVSVYCLSYNHSKYIRDTLNSVLNQKTNFEYEIIVFDDASTDNTQDIIKEYAEKHSIINAICSKVNTYSQNIESTKAFFGPATRGKYVCFCECDDYWTDDHKLQVLVDFMENHPDYSMCCHSYNNIDASTGEIKQTVCCLPKTGEYSIKNAIEYGNNPPQLASQIFKSEVVVNQPDLFIGRGVGDYTLLLYAATQGKMYYLDANMANHRVGSDNSWTNRVYRNPELRTKHYKQMIAFLNDYNEFTNYKYSAYVDKRISEYDLYCLIVNKDYKSIVKHPLFKQCSKKRKMLVYMGKVFPRLVSKIDRF